MASFEVEIIDSNVENGIKRKSNKVEEKSKKKKKNEQMEMVEETVEVVEKVKKKKKKIESSPIKEETIEGVEKNTLTESTESYINTKSTKKVKELPTVTIAVPGSILDNAQSPEFRTYLAGQIARAACIYKIDEVCF